MGNLSALEPKPVFAYFEKLCAVPHGSGNTRQISALCAETARSLSLDCRQDALGNLVIRKPGASGCETAAPVILQGHLDMVCAKAADCPRDMTREGPTPVTDGQWVWAEGTSLGGDNGIAVAMILAILADHTHPHPPLEAVLTVDEEVGLVGAFALDGSDLRGRQLLNLDSEEEGVFTVSCAGGERLDCHFPAAQAPINGEVGRVITLTGLQGGHSGVDINKGRASANSLLVRTLRTALEQVPGLRLSSLQGGKFDNVICSECTALAVLPPRHAAELDGFLRAQADLLKAEYASTDSGLTLTSAPAVSPQALSHPDTRRILEALAMLPQGVQTMSRDFPGLVQTSLNLGTLSLEPDGLHAVLSLRSSAAAELDALRGKVREIIERGGGTASSRNPYPAWEYQKHSPMRDRLSAAYRDLTGREAELKATHGGLECGIFVQKLPGLDAVSLGPDLRDVHSPKERLNAASAARVYELLWEFLRRSC